MKKILSHISKKYRTIVHNVRMHSANKRWDKRLKAAVAKFPVAGETQVAEIVLKNQIDALRINMAAMNVDSYEQRKTQDKMALVHFAVTSEALRVLIPLNNLVGIQPMSGPVALAYRLGYQYTPTEQVDQLPLIGATSGKRISLAVLKEPVMAGSRKLLGRWNLETVQNISATRGPDIESEMTDALGYQVADEMITEILDDLYKLASDKLVFEWDAAGDGNPSKISDRAAMLCIRINQACNRIAAETRRGAGNFIVTSPVMISILQMSPHSSFTSSTTEEKKTTTNGPLVLMGTLHGTVKVWMHLFAKTNDILVGYKGTSGAVDTGFVYCPYVMLLPTGIFIDPATFAPHVQMITRYGKATWPADENSLGSSTQYYAVVKVKGMDDNGLFGMTLGDPVDEETTLV